MEDEGFGAADVGGEFLVAARLAGLALQAFDLGREAAHDVAEPREVVLGGLEAQFGFVAAAVQAGDAGGVFENAAALFGLGVDDFGDLALAHEGGRAGAGGGIFEQDLDIAGAHFFAVDAVGGAGFALDAARDFDDVVIVEFGGRLALGVVEKERDFGGVAGGRVLVPEKITSSMAAARMDLCEVSPMTQRSASSRLDLPQPFGPTTPVRPASTTRSVGSTNDLKPKSLRRLIFIRCGL
jgi:hypothetical protein